MATGKSWCPEHFVCANSSCRRRLLECGFVEEDGQKFCETCFEQHIAPRCAKCSKPIISDCLNALQKKWHPTCFTCAHCQKPFGNSAFYLEQGLPYCEQDWNALFTTKCVSCRYPIEAGDRWVEALGNAFHSNCFTCTVTLSPFAFDLPNIRFSAATTTLRARASSLKTANHSANFTPRFFHVSFCPRNYLLFLFSSKI